jgi:hypothetical protein
MRQGFQYILACFIEEPESKEIESWPKLGSENPFVHFILQMVTYSPPAPGEQSVCVANVHTPS